jgi:putative FmdB family regulatory protein
MPTYEYACLSCGHHVEVYQRFSDEPLTVCGVCGGPLRKVFHPAGILFKGSGFYATDSRSSRSGARGDSGKGESGGGESRKAAPAASESGAGHSGDGGGSAGTKSGASETKAESSNKDKKEKSA